MFSLLWVFQIAIVFLSQSTAFSYQDGMVSRAKSHVRGHTIMFRDENNMIYYDILSSYAVN